MAEIKSIEGLSLSDGKARGRGCYGTVYEVRVHGVPCIAKRLHDILVGRGGQEPVGARQRRVVIDSFRRECELHRSLRHPNIVQFMGVHYGRNEADISLIMESMHMDLDQCMKKYPNIPLPYKTSILRDVAYGLAYLHSIPIIHRDLNAGNVLLTESLRAKIADLGVAKLFDREAALVRTRTMCPGAPDFMPPESLARPPRYSDKLDIFSFGHLAIYLINQEAPYVQDSTVTEEDFKKKEMQVGKRRSSLNQMGGSRHPLFTIIVHCLHDNPDKRPSSRELAGRMEEQCKQQPLPHINTLETLAELNRQSAELNRRSAELKTFNNRVKERDQAISAKQSENNVLRSELAMIKALSLDEHQKCKILEEKLKRVKLQLYSVQRDLQDEVALGYDHQEKLAQHESRTDAKNGFSSKFGVQKDRQDQVYQPFDPFTLPAVGFKYQAQTATNIHALLEQMAEEEKQRRLEQELQCWQQEQKMDVIGQPKPGSVGKTMTARAVRDYQAEGEDEISFDPDDIIKNIEQVDDDDGWWIGEINGKRGLFPATFVELL